MPMYDYACSTCGRVATDVLEPVSAPPRVCGWDIVDGAPKRCEGVMDRVLMPTGRGTVIGDECDVTVRHGLCHSDGTPQRFTSKAAMRRQAEQRGLTNHVEHKPASRGSDKSPHTSRWI